MCAGCVGHIHRRTHIYLAKKKFHFDAFKVQKNLAIQIICSAVFRLWVLTNVCFSSACLISTFGHCYYAESS